MKKTIAVFLGIIAALSYCLFFACDNSTEPDDQHDFPDPIDSVAHNISLNVYSVRYDSLLATSTLETEGLTTVDVADTGLVVDRGLNIYAGAEGFYTKLYYRNDGDTLTIDLDAVPNEPNSITGVIFSAPSEYGHCYYASSEVNVSGPDGFEMAISTDSEGRYGLADLPLGDYILAINLPDSTVNLATTNTAGVDYNDFSFVEIQLDRAPYIYLYPEHQSDISVSLCFLQGGRLTESEPPYGDGWNVNVMPDGRIDGQYDYLFYEANLPHLPILETGWLLRGDNLQGDINELMTGLGFNDNEISDFTDFWIPRIEGHPYYAFYYLNPDSIVALDINPAPDNILRVRFVIQPLAEPRALQPPQLSDNFSRDGFTAVEWGVIGWPDK